MKPLGGCVATGPARQPRGVPVKVLGIITTMMVEPHDDSELQATEPPSKTQRKKEMHALQALGEQLVRLRRDQLQRIELPDALREAIEFAHRVTSHEARRRHMQYVGKLMRQADAIALRQALAQVTGESRASVALMHNAERWREKLLADDAALTEFIADHPDADVQWLRAAIRAARREIASQRPPRHARELYRWLHEQLEPRSHEG
jgi:ribosome-associated protein